MKKRVGLVLAASLVAAAVASANAGAQAGGARGEGRGQGRREEAYRIVDAYVLSHLQESLTLSDEQYVKILPLVTKLQNDRRDFFLSRARVLREMHRALRAGGASETTLVEKLSELKRLESEGPARVKGDVDTLDAALTPLQQAKFRVLELEVERRMRELVGRARPGSARGPRD